LEVVRVLVENGANVRANNAEAISQAATQGHLEIVRLLIEKGDHSRSEINAALRNALDFGHSDVAKLLRKAAQGPIARCFARIGEKITSGSRLNCWTLPGVFGDD
jgi:ankyrin repeat protein